MILLSSSLSSFLQLIGVLIIFLFVLLITYLTTKWMGGYQKAQMVGKKLQVIETARLVGNKYVQVIKAGEVYLVVAVGKDTVTMLAQLTQEQYESAIDELQTAEDVQYGSGSLESFSEILEKFKGHFSKKQD